MPADRKPRRPRRRKRQRAAASAAAGEDLGGAARPHRRARRGVAARRRKPARGRRRHRNPYWASAAARTARSHRRDLRRRRPAPRRRTPPMARRGRRGRRPGAARRRRPRWSEERTEAGQAAEDARDELRGRLARVAQRALAGRRDGLLASSSSRKRKLLAIGYRLDEGRLDPTPTSTCWPPRRGWRACWRSRKGDLPADHWFRLGGPCRRSAAARRCCRGRARCSST